MEAHFDLFHKSTDGQFNLSLDELIVNVSATFNGTVAFNGPFTQNTVITKSTTNQIQTTAPTYFDFYTSANLTPIFRFKNSLGSTDASTIVANAFKSTLGTASAILKTANAGNTTLILPNSQGYAGQFLTTDGSGNTSWAEVGGGGGGITSVGISAPSFLSVSSSPITVGAGTIGLAIAGSPTLNQVLTITNTSPITASWTTPTIGSVTSVSASVPNFLTSTVTNATTTPNIAITMNSATVGHVLTATSASTASFSIPTSNFTTPILTSNSTNATSPVSGSIVTPGGMGVYKDLWVGGETFTNYVNYFSITDPMTVNVGTVVAPNLGFHQESYDYFAGDLLIQTGSQRIDDAPPNGEQPPIHTGNIYIQTGQWAYAFDTALPVLSQYATSGNGNKSFSKTASSASGDGSRVTITIAGGLNQYPYSFPVTISGGSQYDGTFEVVGGDGNTISVLNEATGTPTSTVIITVFNTNISPISYTGQINILGAQDVTMMANQQLIINGGVETTIKGSQGVSLYSPVSCSMTSALGCAVTSSLGPVTITGGLGIGTPGSGRVIIDSDFKTDITSRGSIEIKSSLDSILVRTSGDTSTNTLSGAGNISIATENSALEGIPIPMVPGYGNIYIECKGNTSIPNPIPGLPAIPVPIGSVVIQASSNGGASIKGGLLGTQVGEAGLSHVKGIDVRLEATGNGISGRIEMLALDELHGDILLTANQQIILETNTNNITLNASGTNSQMLLTSKKILQLTTGFTGSEESYIGYPIIINSGGELNLTTGGGEVQYDITLTSSGGVAMLGNQFTFSGGPVRASTNYTALLDSVGGAFIDIGRDTEFTDGFNSVGSTLWAQSYFGTTTLSSVRPITTFEASTVYIRSAPITGDNQIITYKYALHVESGTSLFEGEVQVYNGIQVKSYKMLLPIYIMSRGDPNVTIIGVSTATTITLPEVILFAGVTYEFINPTAAVVAITTVGGSFTYTLTPNTVVKIISPDLFGNWIVLPQVPLDTTWPAEKLTTNSIDVRNGLKVHGSLFQEYYPLTASSLTYFPTIDSKSGTIIKGSYASGQIISLFDASTLNIGASLYFVNISSSVVSVKDNDGFIIAVIPSGGASTLTLTAITGTGVWNEILGGTSTGITAVTASSSTFITATATTSGSVTNIALSYGSTLPIANGGTGTTLATGNTSTYSTVYNNSPSIVTPTFTGGGACNDKLTISIHFSNSHHNSLNRHQWISTERIPKSNDPHIYGYSSWIKFIRIQCITTRTLLLFFLINIKLCNHFKCGRSKNHLV